MLQASFREAKLTTESLPLFVRKQKKTSRNSQENFVSVLTQTLHALIAIWVLVGDTPANL